MVVITIIGILASIVFTSLTSAKKKAERVAYGTYAKQIADLFRYAYHYGLFEPGNNEYDCLGNYGASNDCSPTSIAINNSLRSKLQQIGTLPKGPYVPGTSSDYGLSGGYNWPVGGNFIVYLYIWLPPGQEYIEAARFCYDLPPVDPLPSGHWLPTIGPQGYKCICAFYP